LDQALAEAQIAVALSPESVQTQAELGRLLAKVNRPDDARQAFHQALTQATSVHPEMQSGWVPALHSALK
jgi:Flp pilus assembly protein TadD